MGWLRWLPGSEHDDIWRLVGVVLAVVASDALGAVYAGAYGTVEVPFNRTRFYALFFAWWIALALIADFAPRGPYLPLFGPLFIAATLAYIAMANWPYRRHYAVLAAGMVAISFLPLVAHGAISRAFIWNLAVGAGMILAGLADHRVLTRALAHQRKTNGATV
jgi:hypothetical protein